MHLDADPAAPRSLRSGTDDGLRLRLAEGNVHREQVLTWIRGALDCREGRDWNPADSDRPPVIVEPILRTATRFGAPDLLLWSADGYLPVIIRSHRTTDRGSGAITSPVAAPIPFGVDCRRRARNHPADALALAHHVRLLSELGLAAGRAMGGVVGRGGSSDEGGLGNDGSVVVWHELDVPGCSVLADYDARFTDRLAVADAAANGRPALAVPSRISECRRCSWWPVCAAELTSTGDVSLIVAGDDVGVLRAAGIRTADELATRDRATVASLPLTGMDATTARVRARAWLAGWALVRRIQHPQVRRADLELDVDMESFLEDGAYLWGTYLSGPAVARLGLAPGYRPFVSWRPLPDPDEGRAFAHFWAYLTQLRAVAAEQGLTFAAYCYSRAAEERWLRSTPARYPEIAGMPTSGQVAQFCSSPDWVDIYQSIRDQFVVPGSMKLKMLASVAGFTWRDPDPGGENSMAWYRSAVGPSGIPGSAESRGAPIDPSNAARILRYNEDDVRATLALRTWITDSSWTVPTVAELDAD